jgi:hypothetical protein
VIEFHRKTHQKTPRKSAMKFLSRATLAVLVSLPLAAMAQLPSLKGLPGLGALGGGGSSGGDVSGQNDSLVRGYVAANKDVLLANAQMADALGLKDQAAASRATADALTEGATKGNLEDSSKAVSASTDAVAAEIAKGPKLDAASKSKYQAGMAQLGQGLLKYIALRGPAQAFSSSLQSASPMMIPKLQSGVYIVSQLPTGLTNLASSMKNATAFAKSNDIPVPADATKAMASL